MGRSTVVWRDWAALAVSASLGLVLERHGNKFLKTLTAPLLATLFGLAFTNLGFTPPQSAVYGVVNRILLPLAVPMLLFSADMRKVIAETRRLLGVFLLGSLSTCISTIFAFWVCSSGLTASLGGESWKIASALASRHIGGAVNFIAVSQTLDIAGDSVAAALAADNLICALYFMAIFYLTRNIGGESDPSPAAAGEGAPAGEEGAGDQTISVYQAAMAVGLSSAICLASSVLATQWIGKSGLLIPLATGITVVLATAIPRKLAPVAEAGEGVANLIMQFFFAAVGASGSLAKVLSLAPLLFVFAFLQVFGSLGIILLSGKWSKYSLKEIVLASNANVGGPTTAAAMAATKGWRSYFIPAMLSGILGYVIATFVAIGLGLVALKPMTV